MTKILAIFVVELLPANGSQIKSQTSDLSHVGWFQRSSVLQVMQFTAKTVAERTEPGQRHTIDDPEYTAYIYRPSTVSNNNTNSNIAIVTVTDKQYPARAAHCIGPQLFKDMQDLSMQQRQTAAGAGETALQQLLDDRIVKFTQQPQQAMDKVARIQSELDSTREIMHQNIEQVLKRGERLDDLLAKTEELDMQTKMFVKTARKANRRCCSLQ